MDQKITDTINGLGTGFYGEVTFGFKNGKAYFAKVIRTHNFEHLGPKNEARVDEHKRS
jgi:hypothetical protein